MFNKIMVPVDLTHVTRLKRALDCAADMANHYGAEICYVGVTGPTPGAIARNPAEYGEKLKAFADAQAAERAITASHHVEIAHDPTTEVDDALLRAVEKTGADLVVMGTHDPGITDYLWPANGTRVAGHSKASVFLVREG